MVRKVSLEKLSNVRHQDHKAEPGTKFLPNDSQLHAQAAGHGENVQQAFLPLTLRLHLPNKHQESSKMRNYLLTLGNKHRASG